MDKYILFEKRIRNDIPDSSIYTDELRRFCWGTDASFYRLTPRIVIRSSDEKQIQAIMRLACELSVPLTFRAAGTALSGQSVSDSVLVVAGKNWEGYSVSADAGSIRLQTGIIGDRVNRILAPYGRKFGPDPASIKSAMVGGIVANNASGMSCGVHANSDKTLLGARIVMSDGTVLDTGDPVSREDFRKTHPEFLDRLLEIRREVLADDRLVSRIRRKYSIKNVTGLNILPLITFDDPFDIIAHLMVGSEGTLAFLSEVTMKTLPVLPLSASAMIYFRSITDASKAVVAMKEVDVCAAELLDSRSLSSVNDTTGEGLTAVLTQVQARSREELDALIDDVGKVLKDFDTVTGVNFSTDPAECAAMWAIRSGIFPTVGGMRRPGTTCLIEDVAFHIEDLPGATADLSDLLDRHGYDDSCIYGHALEGNFHFIINQSFETEDDVRRYENMIRDVARLVVEKYDGSLKAEHGTGRNMAPFVSYEWGEKAFAVMRSIKHLFDPQGILNPGVIFNDDPKCFIRDFKSLPLLESSSAVNKCIECGFCEVNCLSCGFTLSSRTRIAARREIKRLKDSGEDPRLLQKLLSQYKYLGEETCAGDGLCSMSCPMGINVADLTHELRTPSSGSFGYKAWSFAADNFHGIKNSLRLVLWTADTARKVLGNKAMGAVCRSLHGTVSLPLWTPSTPGPYKVRINKITPSTRKVVYFPSCINQMMGASADSKVRRPLVEEMTGLLTKAGYEVIFPERMDSLCCGTIWESKGMADIAEGKVRELEDTLWKASCEGKYPVLCDQSPCLHRMRQKITRMHLYEPVEFIWKFLRDSLVFHQKNTPVVIHQACSMRLMGLADTLSSLASLCSTEVLVPEGVGCCGFAGDRGMTHPELNAYALRKLRSQVEESGIKVGYSNSRTCEIGLSTNSGIPYVSIVYLVNECTTARR